MWDTKWYLIRRGAVVRMDFSSVVWENENTLFELKQPELPPPDGWVWLKAPNYGGDLYGSGPVLARWDDVIKVYFDPYSECESMTTNSDEHEFPEVGRFRKRPVVVDAVRWVWPNWNAICDFAPIPDVVYVPEEEKTKERPSLRVRTLEGEMVCHYGDWIVRGVKGEFYPVRDDIFRQTYEPATTRG